MNKPKERPILFNSEMVQAILDGRKTQTRRMVKPAHVEYIEFMGGSDNEKDEFEFVGLEYAQYMDDNNKTHPAQWLVYCTEYPEEGVVPLGQLMGKVGDRLWVRETFCTYQTISHRVKTSGASFSDVSDGFYGYRADGFGGIDDFKEHVRLMSDESFEGVEVENDGWRPSIHMPRKACRIILEITNVRVERVQDITQEDAQSEGFELIGCGPACSDPDSGGEYRTPAENFSSTWDSIYKNWSDNPWVWVVEFKVLTTDGTGKREK